jgi:hypothetical protein
MLKEKHGKQIPAVSGAKKPTASNALNLMEVLKRSLEAESPRRAAPVLQTRTIPKPQPRRIDKHSKATPERQKARSRKAR